ncbi:MAG TPA: hypothetical protein VMB22_09235, partial [Verrucomicrobiae bacterium]|nr:hypothetical protein [Verrucomicrobiae bacterium]
TCPGYLTRFGTVSHRPPPPSPSFAFDTRERARGTGEFCLRRRPFSQLERSRINQPDPTFPRSPGIILETNCCNLSTAAARFVLSMNCEHHSKFFTSDNELICTACSPNRAVLNGVNAVASPINSMQSSFRPRELFTAISAHNRRGEQVLFVAFQKNSRSTERFSNRKIFWNDCLK